MIVVDTSVFVASILSEPDEGDLMRRLSASSERSMSAGTYLECAIVIGGKRAGFRHDLDRWVAQQRLRIVPVDADQARLAADAFARFGKGRHAAGLNFGDCFAYALAMSLKAPLLFKGGDFALTDVASALPAR